MTETPARCPWCKKSTELEFTSASPNRVLCMNSACEATGPFRKTNADAISAWNRIAKDRPA